MSEPADAVLEAEISRELDACHAAKAAGKRDQAYRHWERFVSLIAKRTPKRVRQMEREKGLA